MKSAFLRPAIIGALCMYAAAGLFAQSGSIFVPITPCRIVDTRGAAGPFGGPTMSPNSTRSFGLPSGACGVPATATAYALNITVVPQGALQYLTIWGTGQTQPVVSTLNAFAGQIVANAALVPAGTSGAVSVFVTNTTDVILDINGYFSIKTASTVDSTSFGVGALASDTGAGYNLGIGTNSINGSSTGKANTAIGALTLQKGGSGTDNTGIGSGVFQNNIANGSGSTAVGAGSQEDDGQQGQQNNVSVGYNSLSGGNNDSNIALGAESGVDVQDSVDVIDIGYFGTDEPLRCFCDDTHRLAIGTAVPQFDGIQGPANSAFISGITGVPITGAALIVSANGQLGIAASSVKYKQDVHEIGPLGDALMQLRPVAFRYKQDFAGRRGLLQYGLIAEDVDKVYPDLVARDLEGRPMSVQYHELPALLLNELQKQHRSVQQAGDSLRKDNNVLAAQQKSLDDQHAELRQLEQRLADLDRFVKTAK